MFKTFSGTSRRPRQVNLSGQEPDVFAAWGESSAASGTQRTVAVAVAERQHRQQERERLNATKRIQRVWRGHRSRRVLADANRTAWDTLEGDVIWQGARASSEAVRDLRLLLSFFNPQNPEDVERLGRFGDKLLQAIRTGLLSERDLQQDLLRLSKVLLNSLTRQLPNFNRNLLLLVKTIVQSDPQIVPKICSAYYEMLASLAVHSNLREDEALILDVICAPLLEHSGIKTGSEISLMAYVSFAQLLLCTANLSHILGGLEKLAAKINTSVLSEAVVLGTQSKSFLSVQPESRLWLLANFIDINRNQNGTTQEPFYLRALSSLLSSSADEIVGRIDVEDLDELHQTADGDDEAHVYTSPLPHFVKSQLVTLVNKKSITDLLLKFNVNHNSSQSSHDDDDTSMLASYALTLLRIFPRLGDEIRMWLYQSSVAATGSSTRIPAVKLFWRVMTTTSTFSAIVNDSESALEILRCRGRHQNSSLTHEEPGRENDWRAILLFLELYAFVLRFTDDEEFLSGGTDAIMELDRSISRSRESALPLQDVKLLTMFLKNLSFTLYYNSTEILEDDQASSHDEGLGSYFGMSSSNQLPKEKTRSVAAKDSLKQYSQDRRFLGIAGMSFTYVRNIVTMVMRMLYERDSRRRFLPKDHWLMTSRFDMEGFIPAVVLEEERRHKITEDEEEEDDEEPLMSLFPGPRNRIGTQRARRTQQQEILSRQQQRSARKKMLASIAPRLEVLQNMPYAIPFATRVQVFRQFVYRDQVRRRHGHVDPDHWRLSIMQHEQLPLGQNETLSKHHATIRRDQVFEDAYRQFYVLGEGLKEPIQITFVDKFNTIEAGIDGGGVMKEFLTSVTNEAFKATSDATEMFVANDQNLLYPNPSVLDQEKALLRLSDMNELSPGWQARLNSLLNRYEFLGRLLGKCLYEGILVDIGFAGFFLLKWASTNSRYSTKDSGYLASINDLRDLDESLYQGLLQLKNYPGDVSDFSLDFTIDDTVVLPGMRTQTITRKLQPQWQSNAVTNENRVLYVSGVACHRLHIQPLQQTQAFLRGLWSIINPSWLSMFNQAELQTLLGGDSSEIDIEDLRRNTIYGGVYEIGDDGLEHQTIEMFWQVMKRLDDSDRRKVLKFVTSTPRAPLLGFAQLNPRFSIRDAGHDEQRLPSTSTCINLLKLPCYQTPWILKQKLLDAVNSGAGFDLS